MTPKILIVDEDRDMREAIAQLFSAGGYRVAMARDEVSALFQLGLTQPDLVILGECEPNILCRIRTRSLVPIIALTADAPVSGVDSLDRGADLIVVKPPSMVELKAKARALVRRL